MAAPRLLVFDSGVGGLTVLAAINRALPDASLFYVADDAAFPYGNLADDVIVERCRTIMTQLIPSFRPDAVVIACNTASTLALPALRERFRLPFIGTVPAIKPAAEQTRSGLISVLATPGTVRRDYTRDLIHVYASHVHVRLIGSARLAQLAELDASGQRVDEAKIMTEVGPAFYDVENQRTDTVVLGCTHYPLLAERLTRIAPWPVNWIDPSDAIARRVVSVIDGFSDLTIGPGVTRSFNRQPDDFAALFTSGREIDAQFSAVMKVLGVHHLLH